MGMLFSDDKSIFEYLYVHPQLHSLFTKLTDSKKKVVKDIISIGQGDRVFSGVHEEDFSEFDKLLGILVEIDLFYENIGGIIGYHSEFISLMKKERSIDIKSSLQAPYQVDISERTIDVQKYIDIGVNSLPNLAEIYPIGGAGDRLNLKDERTKEPLPQVKFNFMGKTLIEHLILDLKAREYFYFKIYKQKVITPIVIMTSEVKKNHQHVLDIFEENNYFDRPEDSFLFIKQISVPIINEEGNWVIKGKLELDLKPGGHGVLWNLMIYHKAFDWLYNKKRTKAVIRQINNLVAAVDYNIFAFSGYGIGKNKKFGFASCPRRVGSEEGMDVLKEKKVELGYEYNNSNIEYTDFKRCGISDISAKEGSDYSKFPSNTNTLFVDLKSVEEAAKRSPLPGITINLKSTYLEEGRKLKAGRLELLMQGVADNFIDFFENRISDEKQCNLTTFVTKNIRRKTITTIKKPYIEGESIYSTPVGSYFVVHQNFSDTLSNYCKMDIPEVYSIDDFIKKGPSFICYLNPMLGPMFSDIGKKIRGGRIIEGSELWLDIADVEIEDLVLSGSLLVYGSSENFEKVGKCILKNVKVENQGIDKEAKNNFYENKIFRKEFLKIIVNENSVFEAEDVILGKDQIIEVPPHHKIKAFSKDGKIFFEKSKLL